jgi:sigma-B regulation protein RsbU (phosphoserine phosphatase)
VPGLDVQAVYHPSGRASGDYYDFFPIDDHVLRAVIADVSGHGARAAFLMAIVRALIRTTESYYLSLADALGLVNQQLCDIIGNERDFVTLFAADVDIKNKVLSYINAGQSPGVLIDSGQSNDILEPTSTVLGFFDLDFSTREIDISEKTGLFLFTDGYYEWEIIPNEQYGLENFLDLISGLLKQGDFNIEELEQELMRDKEFKPSFRDDRSAVWIRWDAP